MCARVYAYVHHVPHVYARVCARVYAYVHHVPRDSMPAVDEQACTINHRTAGQRMAQVMSTLLFHEGRSCAKSCACAGVCMHIFASVLFLRVRVTLSALKNRYLDLILNPNAELNP